MVKKLNGLYAITDASLIPEKNFADYVSLALDGGANIIQYRDKSNDIKKRLKQAEQLQSLCQKYNSLLIINDDVQLALDIDADGVHIGIDDSSLGNARITLGDNKIIGVSCYNQFELAQQAQNESADYVAFGSFFSSPTKPNAIPANIDLLIQAKTQLSIPVCSIGGININNAKQLISAGTDMIAVISAIFAQADIKQSAESFVSLFSEHKK